jgi:hypothetical protein
MGADVGLLKSAISRLRPYSSEPTGEKVPPPSVDQSKPWF